jgi:GNAT superfamily N-acetyltransferase
MTISHRPALTADRQFIVTTWSASYKKSHSAGLVTADDWAGIMHPQLEKILDRTDARAMIATEKSDPDFFYGWIAGDTSESVPVVYFVYVKQPYRRTGIARGLLKAFGVDPSRPFVYVCKTGIVATLSPKIPFARFNNNEVRYSKESRRNPL